ncbi:hypothetical protein HJG54_33805 [Leptolyngbya sp. NK1-12]|uniref:Uncharacterized protein n=1 Tax=Leptolyngbya sp. NK1-12 TaxID=2547451 RepID=A0AA96WLN7_9CYAN|nr:hypothetical protein [Leptolyngbya sp. NK1-12]WNZ27808.1 hypothetical protein HJG54_33805 [Leptolyngbya sp. NK1-12]
MPLSPVQPLLETWLPASWDEFVKLADNPASAKLKGYYYCGHMRFEPISTGSDHSNDHALILFALSFFAADHGIPIRHIRKSQVLLGLKLEILEQALQRSRQENQSATTAWLIEQLRA